MERWEDGKCWNDRKDLDFHLVTCVFDYLVQMMEKWKNEKESLYKFTTVLLELYFLICFIRYFSIIM